MQEYGRDHIVPVPKWFTIIKYVQLLLAVVVLALSAYGLSGLSWLGGADYSIFVAIATFIIVGYYLLSTIRLVSLYNKIAVLVLECFMVIWWLSTWAYLASWAAAFTLIDDPVCDGYGNCYGDDSYFNNWASYRDALAAAAGIGALNFVLFIITLVVFGIRFHRHRISGAPTSCGGHWANGATNGSGTGGPGEKAVPMQAANAPSYPQQTQQPAYNQQQGDYIQQAANPPAAPVYNNGAEFHA